MAQRAPWYCGTMRAIPTVIGNRVVTYRYVAVHGCGELNRGSNDECQKCGRERYDGKAIA